MSNRLQISSEDRPASDLNRRIALPGIVGVAGKVSPAVRRLAAEVGLPTKDAWIFGVQHSQNEDGIVLNGLDVRRAGVSAPGMDAQRERADFAVVRPVRTAAEVETLLAELDQSGLKAAKRAELAEFLPKVAASPDGFVVQARLPGRRHACAVLSLFREVEVDGDMNVSYHVHIEETVDLSEGAGAAALETCFALQAEANLAVLAHSLKAAKREGEISLLCESNNHDTRNAPDDFAVLVEKALERIRENPDFVAAVGDSVEFSTSEAISYP